MQLSLDQLGTPLRDVTFCVIDLETTGAVAGTDAITEVGAARYRGGECLGTLATLVNPGRAIPPEITYLTGITQAMVAPAPRITEVLGPLVDFVGDAVIVGHNVGFDLAFLAAALRGIGLDPFRNPVVDTVKLARRLVRDEVRDCRLGTLAATYRFPHTPTHRALDDVRATADLLHLLIERATGLGVMGLDDLKDLPTLARHRHAPKLALTSHLPHAPGVYLFRGGDGEVLYVGKATDLRSRTRSYFGSDDRRQIAPLLTELQRIAHVECPSPFEAAVLEVRLIQRLLPRFNRASTHWPQYCYVRVPSRASGRWVVTPNATGRDPHIGPFPSRGAARAAVVALEAALVARGRAADHLHLLRHPAELLAPLHERMGMLAAGERFEEAAALRDRCGFLARALARQLECGALVATEHLRVRSAGQRYAFTHGRLHLEHLSTPTLTIGPMRPMEPDPVREGLPVVDRALVDELALGVRFIAGLGGGAVVEECRGDAPRSERWRVPLFLPRQPAAAERFAADATGPRRRRADSRAAPAQGTSSAWRSSRARPRRPATPEPQRAPDPTRTAQPRLTARG